MKLKANQIANLDIGKRHSDGGGLYIELRKGGTGSWLYRYTVNGRANWMSLGAYPEVSLSRARELAAEKRGLKSTGVDPVKAKRQAARQSITVEEAVREYWKLKCTGLAKAEGWIRMFEIHAFPKIGSKGVADLTSEDVVRVLKPLWKSKDAVGDGETGYPTAKRILTRLRLVLTHAKFKDPRVDPFIIDVAREALPKVEWEEEHHPSLPWAQAPDLWVSMLDSVAGEGLRMIILTGLRVACVTKAEWSEVDFDAGVWTVPRGRVKGWNAGFRVPLTRPMTDVLKRVQKATGTQKHIFHSPTAWKKGFISENTWNKWLEENGWKDADGRPATAHGFRSTFRDWAAKHGWARDLAEHSIQHVSAKGTKVERAYWREDRLEDRAELMMAWNDFVVGKEVAQRMAAGARQRALDRLDEVVLADGRTLREAEEWARYDGLEGEVDASQPADD
ncbi:hypothetical protein LPB142_04020 [Rhodobacter xanthinilyticus]|uniref:Tyr recombinase domain-containing protein n=1 Tax=Rhodobacter xanthinilyticus TaxID=1850250 RepID=A0A1D9M9P4_9RHOB|nr:site-specific integrase [Rhodobacter xanthinilyticus]AOZ68586.1 hypothetical protein LPB142_04020 [Rhodobacter xanthinilyticus]